MLGIFGNFLTISIFLYFHYCFFGCLNQRRNAIKYVKWINPFSYFMGAVFMMANSKWIKTCYWIFFLFAVSFVLCIALYESTVLWNFLYVTVFLFTYFYIFRYVVLATKILYFLRVEHVMEIPRTIIFTGQIVANILVILTYCAFRKSMFYKEKMVSKACLILYSLIIGGSLLYIECSTLLLDVNISSNKLVIMGVIHFIITLLDVIAFAYLECFLRLMNIKQCFNIATEERDMSEGYIQVLEEKYMQSQKIIHDMLNHLQIMEVLYQENEYDHAEQYQQRVIDELRDTKQIRFIEHKALNMLFHLKTRIADSKNVKCSYIMDKAPYDFISDFDWITILGNLLDNAIHECENKGGEIIVKGVCHNQMLVIFVTNPLFHPVETGLAKEKMKHAIQSGIGLRNVRNAVSKYHGEMNIEYSNNLFEVMIQFIIPQ